MAAAAECCRRQPRRKARGPRNHLQSESHITTILSTASSDRGGQQSTDLEKEGRATTHPFCDIGEWQLERLT